MLKPLSIAGTALLITIASWTEAVSAVDVARVEFAIGTIVQPSNLKAGEFVARGTTIQSGANGMVMISHQWPADGGDCVSVTVFGYGRSYTVAPDASPQGCKEVRPLEIPAAKQAFLATSTRP